MLTAPLVRPWITYEDLCRLPPDGHRYEAGAYRLAASLRAGDRATTPLLPALVIDLSQLFQS